jgi:Icc-related predicted phosphoesterase
VSKINILALSDLHIRKKFPFDKIKKIISQENITLITISGDFTMFGNVEEIKSILQEFDQFNLPIFYVPGNMDSENSTEICFSNIHPLHGRCKSFSGFNFIGLGGSNPTPFHTPFELTEEKIEIILNKAKNGIENEDPIIFVSHPPPKDSAADKIFGGRHVGSSIVRNFVDKYQPVLILCGHIHESKSISQIDETICINPGPAMHRKAAIVKVDKNAENKVTIDSELITF